MQCEVTVQCPWCFEFVLIWVDPQAQGEMVQDCEVCCRPWVMQIRRDGQGAPVVTVHRGNT